MDASIFCNVDKEVFKRSIFINFSQTVSPRLYPNALLSLLLCLILTPLHHGRHVFRFFDLLDFKNAGILFLLEGDEVIDLSQGRPLRN